MLSFLLEFVGWWMWWMWDGCDAPSTLLKKTCFLYSCCCCSSLTVCGPADLLNVTGSLLLFDLIPWDIQRVCRGKRPCFTAASKSTVFRVMSEDVVPSCTTASYFTAQNNLISQAEDLFIWSPYLPCVAAEVNNWSVNECQFLSAIKLHCYFTLHMFSRTYIKLTPVILTCSFALIFVVCQAFIIPIQRATDISCSTTSESKP